MFCILKKFTIHSNSNFFRARANPPDVEYRFTNPDRATVPDASDAMPGARVTSAQGQGTLTIKGAVRGDRGEYRVK